MGLKRTLPKHVIARRELAHIDAQIMDAVEELACANGLVSNTLVARRRAVKELLKTGSSRTSDNQAEILS